MNLPSGLDNIFAVLTAVFALLSFVSSLLSGRFNKQGLNLIHKLLGAVGKPNPEHARPTTGRTLSEQVESLGENQHASAELQLETARILIQVAKALSQIRGVGGHRIDTATIETIVHNQEINNGK